MFNNRYSSDSFKGRASSEDRMKEIMERYKINSSAPLTQATPVDPLPMSTLKSQWDKMMNLDESTVQDNTMSPGVRDFKSNDIVEKSISDYSDDDSSSDSLQLSDADFEVGNIASRLTAQKLSSRHENTKLATAEQIKPLSKSEELISPQVDTSMISDIPNGDAVINATRDIVRFGSVGVSDAEFLHTLGTRDNERVYFQESYATSTSTFAAPNDNSTFSAEEEYKDDFVSNSNFLDFSNQQETVSGVNMQSTVIENSSLKEEEGSVEQIDNISKLQIIDSSNIPTVEELASNPVSLRSGSPRSHLSGQSDYSDDFDSVQREISKSSSDSESSRSQKSQSTPSHRMSPKSQSTKSESVSRSSSACLLASSTSPHTTIVEFPDTAVMCEPPNTEIDRDVLGNDSIAKSEHPFENLIQLREMVQKCHAVENIGDLSHSNESQTQSENLSGKGSQLLTLCDSAAIRFTENTTPQAPSLLSLENPPPKGFRSSNRYNDQTLNNNDLMNSQYVHLLEKQSPGLITFRLGPSSNEQISVKKVNTAKSPRFGKSTANKINQRKIVKNSPEKFSEVRNSSKTRLMCSKSQDDVDKLVERLSNPRFRIPKANCHDDLDIKNRVNNSMIVPVPTQRSRSVQLKHIRQLNCSSDNLSTFHHESEIHLESGESCECKAIDASKTQNDILEFPPRNSYVNVCDINPDVDKKLSMLKANFTEAKNQLGELKTKVNDLEAKNQDLNDQIYELTHENIILKESMASAGHYTSNSVESRKTIGHITVTIVNGNENVSAIDNILILKSELDGLVSDRNNQELLISGYQKENERLMQEMKKKSIVDKQLRIQYFEQQDVLNKEINRLNNALNNFQDPIRASLVPVQSVQERIHILQTRLNDVEAEATSREEDFRASIARMQSDNDILRASLTKCQSELNDTRKKLEWYAENQQILDVLHEENLSLKTLNYSPNRPTVPATPTTSRIRELEKTVHVLTKCIQQRSPDSVASLILASSAGQIDKSNQISRYQNEIKKMQEEIEDLRKGYSLKLRSLKQQHEGVSMQYSKLLSEKNVVKEFSETQSVSKIKELEYKISFLEANNTELKETLRTNEANHLNHVDKTNFDNTRYHELLLLLDSSNSKITELEAKLVSDRQNSIDELNIAIQDLKSVHADAIKLIHEQHRQSTQGQALEYTAIIENMRLELNESKLQLNSQVEDWQREKSQLQNQIQEYKSTLNEYSLKLSQANQDIHTLKSTPVAVQIQVMDDQIRRLENKLHLRENESQALLHDAKVKFKMSLTKLQSIHEQEIREKEVEIVQCQNQLEQLINVLKFQNEARVGGN